MSHQQSNFDQFKSQLNELSAIVQSASNCFGRIADGGWKDACEKIIVRLANERFRVIVLGEFKRGKSTFINAMLGQEVLPAFATPCTAVINEVKWGDKPRAVLHFKDPLPTTTLSSLPEAIHEHIRRSSTSPAPCLQIPIEELERYVTIPDPSKSQAESISETPYDKVELFWPLEILQNGVELIDSPGLNEHGSRTKVTKDYLGHVDAVIFLLSVHALASQTEMAVIEHDVRACGHDYIFFVCNRFDELRKQSDRDRVMNFSYEQLAPKTAFSRDGVFFVSALDAVIGREEGRADLVARSGMSVVEAALATFLVNERGRVKLLQPARQLANGLHAALNSTLPHQRNMLTDGLMDLEQRYEAVKPRLAEAEEKRKGIIARLDRSRQRFREAIRNAALVHLKEIASTVPMWVNGLRLENRINAFKFFKLEQQVQVIADEIVREITPLCENATMHWRSSTLEPMAEDMLREMEDVANDAVSNFLIGLDSIKVDISNFQAGAALSDSQITPLERIASGVGGFVIGGAGSAIEGATMGFNGVIRGLLPRVLVAVIGIAILHLNPITLVPILIGMGIFRSLRHGDALTTRVKNQIAQDMATALLASAVEQAETMADEVHEQTAEVVTQIDSGLRQELKSVRDQVESVLAIKLAGVEDVNRQLIQLESLESEFRALDTALGVFIEKLQQR